MIPIRLLGNRVHLAPIKQKTQSAAGIHLPMQFQDDAMQYLVLGVGPGRMVKRKKHAPFLMKPECQPGDRCLVDVEQGSVTLSDGTLIVNAWQILMTW